MPELPDIAVYLQALRPRILGARLESTRITHPVQRIRYADNETNYCPGCQTGGRILADRSLSRLLKDDWPRTLDELG